MRVTAALVFLCLLASCAGRPPGPVAGGPPPAAPAQAASPAAAPAGAAAAPPPTGLVPSLEPGACTVADTFTCRFAAPEKLTLNAFLYDRKAGDDTYRSGHRLVVETAKTEATLTVYLPAPGAYRLLVTADLAGRRETLLLRAAALGRPAILAFRLDSTADIDQADRRGMSALMLAARGGHTAAVRLLLERDADAGLRDSEGRTALNWARAAGGAETVALLEDPRYARPPADPARFVGEWRGQMLDFFVGTSLEARLFLDNAGGKADPLLPAVAEELGWLSVGLAESSNANVVNGLAEKNEACCFAVLLDLKQRFRIDPRRIYFAGFSGGAFRAHARAIRFLDEPAAGVLDIGMGLVIAADNGLPVFYLMGEKDAPGRELLAAFPELRKRFGDRVALRTHPGGRVWNVTAALAEGMRWLARR